MESEARLELLDTDVSMTVSVTAAAERTNSSVMLTHVLKKSKLLSVM